MTRSFLREPRRLIAAVILALLALVMTSRCSPGAGSAVTSSASRASGGYSTAQLEALWVQAGGSQSAMVNAACHAMQESSGRPSVTSPNPDGGINVGLWQLDTRGKGAGYTVAQLKDPATNAAVAVRTTGNGTDWSAWATPGC